MRFIRVLPIIALALLASGAYAAGEENSEVFIYKGGTLNESGITVGSWGSGTAYQSAEQRLSGNNSIKITTQSMYAGGRIDFTEPVTLYTGTPARDRYLVFSFFFPEVKKVDPGAGTNNEIDSDPYTIPTVNKLRFVFTSEKGAMTSIAVPTNKINTDDNWMRVAVPICKLKLAEGETTYKLSRIAVFTDIASTIYLGEIKIDVDNTPITARIDATSMVNVNTKAFFLAVVDDGLPAVKYEWDYDATNGIQVESTDMVGSHVYTTQDVGSEEDSKEFTVTLTVKDIYDIKEPVTVKYVVSVN